MKKFITLSFVFSISFGLIGQQKNQVIYFNPDTSINNKIKLLDKESILNAIGDQSGKLIIDEKESRIQLMNKTGNQYLILYHLGGGNANSFNEFEVGNLKAGNESFKKMDFEYFFSNNNIKLGITKKCLIFIHGTRYKKKITMGNEILEYRIMGVNNKFLLRYNMPIYVATYYFKDDKLIRFRFGLPNW